jgi:hypothetical protein
MLLFAPAGDTSSARELQKFALEAFPSFVTRLTGATMHPYIAQDPLTPAVILFTDKAETPAVFAALSVNLRKYKYRFVDVRSDDVALMQQFNVKKARMLALHACLTITFAAPSDI